ncbi:MAG: PAS domain S-box protein [Vicinamibacteria bacterium]|nr:PAS domain S-box protein [Vicinamibacteria bacterium]
MSRSFGRLSRTALTLILGAILLAALVLLVAQLLRWQDDEERDRLRRTAANVQLRTTMHLRHAAELLELAAGHSDLTGDPNPRLALERHLVREPHLLGVEILSGEQVALRVARTVFEPDAARLAELQREARALGRPGELYCSGVFPCGGAKCFALVQPLLVGPGSQPRTAVATYSLERWLAHVGPRVGEQARVRLLAAGGEVLGEIRGSASGDGLVREAVPGGGLMGRGTTIELGVPPARNRGNVIGLGILSGLIAIGLVVSLGGLAWEDRARRRAAADAAARGAELRGVIASLAEGVLVVGPDGTIRSSNESARRILGLSEEELAARPMSDPRWRFVSTAGTRFGGEPDTGPGMAGGLSGGGSVVGLERDDGTLLWLALNTQPLASEDRAGFGGVVVSLSDVTESRRIDELLRQAVRVSQIGIYDHDQLSDRLYWSPEQRAIFGWGAEQPTSLAIYLECIHPDDRVQMAAAVRRAHDPAGSGQFDVEYRIVRPDGSVRWVSNRGRTLFSGQGLERRPVRSVGAVLDVTERRLAEVELGRALERALQTERELRLHEGAIQAAANSIMLTERNGRIVWVNRAFCELTGYAAEEAVGQTARLLRSGAHPPTFYATLWRTVLDGDVWSGDIVNLRKDGTKYTAEMTITPLRDERGEVSHFVAVSQDVGWRREAEGRLRAAAEEWRTTVDALDSAILLLDGAQRVVRLNRAAAGLLGLDWNECIGVVPWQHSAREPWLAARALVLDRGSRSAQVSDAEGRVFALSAQVRQPADERGPQVVLTLRDVTRVAELQESVRRAETFAAMGRLVGGVAHQVRNPLFAMSVNIDALATVLGESTDVAEMLKALREERDRIGRLMEDLLHYGRPMLVSMTPRPLGPVLDAALGSASHVAASRNVGLRQVGTPVTGSVVMNEERLQEVFTNLLENACQHSPAGSEVVVEAGSSVGPRGPHLWVQVRDAGPGFPLDVLPRVFEPFFTRRKGGTGLGLAIVERFVAEHAGRVHATNAPGGGAVLTVELPLSDAPGA